jgi:hypothetical protein
MLHMRRDTKAAIAILFAISLIAGANGCATLKPSPTDTEAQQTRKLAVQVFQGVELTGTAVEAIQTTEIGMHNAGKVTDDTHRTFQTRLLLTAKVVRRALTQIQMATRLPELKNTLQLIVDDLKDVQTEFGATFAGTPIATGLAVLTAGLSVMLAMFG